MGTLANLLIFAIILTPIVFVAALIARPVLFAAAVSSEGDDRFTLLMIRWGLWMLFLFLVTVDIIGLFITVAVHTL